MKSNMLLTVLLASSVAFAFAAPATSAPLIGQVHMGKSASSSVETVQYRHWHGGNRYYRGGGYHRGGGGAGALIGGLAAGAIIGGVIAAGQANAAAQRNSSYCAQRYRSYDPASGTYLNNNGNRYPCP